MVWSPFLHGHAESHVKAAENADRMARWIPPQALFRLRVSVTSRISLSNGEKTYLIPAQARSNFRTIHIIGVIRINRKRCGAGGAVILHERTGPAMAGRMRAGAA